MRIGGPIRSHSSRARRVSSNAPQAAFLLIVAVAGVVVSSGFVPNDLLMPVISTMLFVLAIVFALVAWVRCSTDEYHVTFWDVSGALVLIGVGAAALIEPDQMARLVSGAYSE